MTAIAYIDDDENNLELYQEFLSKHFTVDTFANGVTCLENIHRQQYECFVVDIRMPQMNGFELVQKIRSIENYHLTPVFFVTSSPEDSVKIQAYQFLAADYFDRLTKIDELVVRIQRRIDHYREGLDILRLGNLKIIPNNIEVFLDGLRLNLTLLEYKILLYFVRNRSGMISKDQLVNYIWPNEIVNANNLNTHLYNLRLKIEKWDHEITGDRKMGFSVVKKV